MSRSKFIGMFLMALFFGLVAVVITSQRTLVVASLAAPAAGSGPRGPSQFYAQHNILSDIPGLADHTDSNLVNAWGLVSGPTTPWWIADNGTGKSTLYNVATDAIQAVFTVPGAGGAQGNPTGIVFNGGTGFVVDNGVGSPSAA
jgi:hypothetical protein